jgi:hypothetical protein
MCSFRSSARPPAFLALLMLCGGCNQPPGAPDVVIEPAAPVTGDDLVAGLSMESEDPDGERAVVYSFAWYQDGALRPDLTDSVLPSEATARGQTWMVEVTPSDGQAAGEFGSASVTIGNTPPSVTASMSPTSPLVSDDLEVHAEGQDDDGDVISFAYRWTVDGEAASQTGSTIPAADTARGEVWEVTVTPDDGSEAGEPVTVSVTIENTAPEVYSAVLGPEEAYEGSTLEVTVELFDADGDEVGVAYQWYVDDVLVLEGEQSWLGGDHFEKGQQVHVEVTPDDGFTVGEALASNAVEISNSAPSLLGASLEPSELVESSIVTCVPSGWADADGDAQGQTYLWYVGAAQVARTESIDGTYFARGDEVYCEVTPDDGETVGEPVTSPSTTVGNTAPTIGAVTLSASSVTEGDTISVTVEGASDDDGDTITFAYAWYVDGVSVASAPSLDGEHFDKGDTLYVQVTPSDPYASGTAVTSDTATVVNSPPVASTPTLIPTEPLTDDVLEATVTTTDADGDSVSVSYTWYIDGSAVGAAGSSLSGAAWFDKGQQVHVAVMPNDGEDNGTAASSDSVLVLNSPPSAPTVAIAPRDPVAGEDDLSCVIVLDATDNDGDSLTYGFSWTVDGALYSGTQVDTATTSLVPASEITDGETWSCSVTADDGEDVGSPGTASVDVGDVCEYPDVSLSTSTGPAPGATIYPAHFDVYWIATVSDDGLHDTEYDGAQESSYLEFGFYDSAGNDLCSIYYDMDGGVAASGWTTDNGGALYGAWEIPLVDGYTTCPEVSHTTWGTTDLRDVLESWTWGVGVGDLIDLFDPLRTAVLNDGQDWTNDWEPYVFGGYLYSDAYGMAWELQYGFGWQAICGVLVEDTSGDLSALPTPASSPIAEGIYAADAYYYWIDTDVLLP